MLEFATAGGFRLAASQFCFDAHQAGAHAPVLPRVSDDNRKLAARAGIRYDVARHCDLAFRAIVAGDGDQRHVAIVKQHAFDQVRRVRLHGSQSVGAGPGPDLSGG